MKRLIFTFIALLICFPLMSQREKEGKFSPEKFKAELECFIIKEAHLTPEEAAKFFPLYDEMNGKQRELFDKARNLGNGKPSTDEECKKAIKEKDKIEIEQKKLQQASHEKFLSVISAKKLFDVIKAEDVFHRQELHKVMERRKDSNAKKR